MSLADSPISILILISTIAVSIYGFRNISFYERFIFKPALIAHERKWYLMITHGFLHHDYTHLIFNMLTFYFFAFQLEQVIGPLNFFVIYFGSMALSSVSTLFKYKDDYNYRAVGASGAVSGILFSMILFAPTAKIYIFFALPVPAPIFAVLYLAYCYYAARKNYDNIGHDAHFWGALAGLVLTIILVPEVLPYFIENITKIF